MHEPAQLVPRLVTCDPVLCVPAVGAACRVHYKTPVSVHARLRKITSEWSPAAHDWKQAMNQFANMYAERFSIRGVK